MEQVLSLLKTSREVVLQNEYESTVLIVIPYYKICFADRHV
jgi:hypothetical protein